MPASFLRERTHLGCAAISAGVRKEILESLQSQGVACDRTFLAGIHDIHIRL